MEISKMITLPSYTTMNIHIQCNPDITILDITMNMLCPGKSYSKMYGTEPRYNDLRYTCNDIPDITM